MYSRFDCTELFLWYCSPGDSKSSKRVETSVLFFAIFIRLGCALTGRPQPPLQYLRKFLKYHTHVWVFLKQRVFRKARWRRYLVHFESSDMLDIRDQKPNKWQEAHWFVEQQNLRTTWQACSGTSIDSGINAPVMMVSYPCGHPIQLQPVFGSPVNSWFYNVS